MTANGDDAPHPLRLLETDGDGVAQLDPLNAEFGDAYLQDPRNPRWMAKPTVAYLWACAVSCKQCRAELPLLKTRWLCRKDNKRVLLTMERNPDGPGVVFGVQPGVPQNGGNGAQRREHDKRIGADTMSRAGAKCPVCGAITAMSDLRYEGHSGRLGAVMTRRGGGRPQGQGIPPTHGARNRGAAVSEERLQALFADIPFGRRWLPP